jgi:hypothetical protein
MTDSRIILMTSDLLWLRNYKFLEWYFFNMQRKYIGLRSQLLVYFILNLMIWGRPNEFRADTLFFNNKQNISVNLTRIIQSLYYSPASRSSSESADRGRNIIQVTVSPKFEKMPVVQLSTSNNNEKSNTITYLKINAWRITQ